MAYFVSKEGVWDVAPGGQTTTPALKVTGLKPGTFVKVTCNFCARSGRQAAGDGFLYSLGTNSTNDVLSMTPTTAIFQGDGWQSCTLVTIFQVMTGTDGEVNFQCSFKNASVTLMSFVMIAELL